MSAVGLPQWAASNPDQYVSIAVRAAENQQNLIKLRDTMRQRMIQSPLRDELRLTRGVEAAFRAGVLKLSGR